MREKSFEVLDYIVHIFRNDSYLLAKINNRKSQQKTIAFTVDPDPRIISGDVAAVGQFKHQVVNRFVVGGGRNLFCGGSLICDNWVLTAAHCAQDATKFTLYFGSVNQSQAVEPGRIVVTATEHYVHPGYDTWNLNNDIALVRLSERVQYTDRIQPITLATHRTGAGQRLTVSGWGRTSQSSGLSPVLRYVALDTISNEDCKRVYGPDVVVNATLCCKGRPEHSTCNGDSGGPLIEWVTDRWVLAGVVSFVHIDGCASGNPSGYVRVENYLDWIRNTIAGTCTLPN
ncbi:hypothetical protein ILUMI_12749 [Ignelater luminosus]|uniref:Peptidase S1 domain-containing protein n=1 Tax=Ignelater luminosus TaxID=2038154 RepID=A0A8K0CTP4_IGNLU|nr:hypothetical protein ILUMI_12749 [Ignelater luminosus]